MSITVAKLAMLAEYYGFDLNEAREYIGLPASNKRGRPAGNEKKPTVPEKKPTVEKKPKVEKKPTTKSENDEKRKRPPTGYQLFLKDYHPIMSAKLKANIKSGEKLTAGAVLSGVGAEWKALSDNKRAAWNKKAAAM